MCYIFKYSTVLITTRGQGLWCKVICVHGKCTSGRVTMEIFVTWTQHKIIREESFTKRLSLLSWVKNTSMSNFLDWCEDIQTVKWTISLTGNHGLFKSRESELCTRMHSVIYCSFLLTLDIM